MERRLADPRSGSAPAFCTQIVAPVAGSNASVRPTPFEAYSTPSTMMGVERKLLFGRSAVERRRSGGTCGRRHATFNVRTFALLI
jgi:hypothetical protein